MLLPAACPACGRPGPAPCEECWRQLRPAPPLSPPDGLRRCRALLVYSGAGRELVARLKYRNGRSVVDWLAAGMAALVPAAAVDGAVDVVTWAPTTRARAAARGFDQAELLASRVAARLDVQCRCLLRRSPGPPQTGRDSASRLAGPEFSAHRRGHVAGRRVLIVDDVVTTGATLSAAARALRSAGAVDVTALAAARTPLKVSGAATDA